MEQKFVTKNHVEIFSYPGQHLHSFCIGLYLKAGSMYETEEENGVTHFLEHVVIRNINWLMDGQLYPYLDRLGLMFNACTYKEFVQFEITGASKHIREAIDVFVKLFEAIDLPAAEIDIERKRIKAEIREDDERGSLGYFTNEIVWNGTSLVRPITGKSTGLDKMGKGTLRRAHEECFVSNNLFFYVTGRADEADIRYLADAVENCHIKTSSVERTNMAPVPKDFFLRQGRLAIKKSSDTVVRFSFDIDSRKYSQAAYMLLYDILFDCENSKIHQALSEQSGYIYSFDPGLEQYSNIGSLYFQYEVQPLRLLDSVRIVMELFCELKKGIRDELDYVKAVYIDNSELILDHASNLNWTQAYEAHILGHTCSDLAKRREEFICVTPEDIVRLAREIFALNNLTVTVKGKKTKKLEREMREILQQLDEEK
ncbi:insulinase family protein [Anaerovorax odorimutans]|uniref:Insulinase family protein n=1 Tax=Anaerovorax odorimutans TaxID=109327 RepID=A0ABT1RQ25_9FIRM|nr:insulinase family protein [Anaerovorax odorimutans]MCQ4637269.1 insulinase family protein [Anaerovorax odorimutans]